jgi:ATP-binding cassette subfamily B protein
LLWNKIAKQFDKLTAFIVSHRLSSLRYVDNILFLDAGKIQAFGNHEALLKENNEYKEFIKHHYK